MGLQRFPFTLAVYFANLASGAAQFLCVLYLQRMLPREDFSVVSLVLSYFAPYLLALELGIQSELIRRFAQAQKSANPLEETEKIYSMAVVLRLFASALSLPIAALSAFMGGASWATLASVVVFLLSFFPSSWLLSLEPLGFVLKNRSFASALRIARTFALVCFVAVLSLAEELFRLSPQRPLWVTLSFLCFVFVFLIYIIIFIPKQFGLRAARVQWPRATSEQKSDMICFLRETASLIAGRVVNFFYGLLFLTFILKLHGEQQLAEFNMANTLVVPYTLFASVLMNRSMSRVYSENKTFFSELAAFAAVSLCFIGLFATAFYLLPVHFIFKDLRLQSLALYLWPLLMSQTLGTMTSMIIQKCQNTRGRLLAVENPVVILLCITATGLIATHRLAPEMAGFWALAVNAIGLSHAALRSLSFRSPHS